MIYLKYLQPYNRVFFFHKRDDITTGDCSLKAFDSQLPSIMSRIFGMEHEDMRTGKIFTLDFRLQEASNGKE